MGGRAVRRAPWYAWLLLGAAGLLAIHASAPQHLQGSRAPLTCAVVIVGVLALRRLWQAPPAATMCAAVALTIFSGGWRQMGLGGLPLDRLLLLFAGLQVLLLAPGGARLPSIQIRGIHLMMGLTAIYATASAAAAETLHTETGLLSLIDLFGLAPYLMFLLAPAIFHGPRERRMLLNTLVGVGLYLGLTAIFESLGPHGLVFPRYILHVDAATPGERAGGPFQSSLAEGFATYSCAVAATIARSQWRAERRPGLVALASATAAVCAFGTFLTLERGVWIAAVAATLVCGLCTQRGRRQIVPGLLACSIAIGAVLAVSPSLSHKASVRASTQTSVWDRENQNAAGLRMVAARPLFGFGWERYRQDSLEYFRQSPDYPMYGYKPGNAEPGEKTLPLHDTYLAYAVELGLVGALLWLITLLWGVVESIRTPGTSELRRWKLGLAAVAVFFLVVAVFNPYQEPFTVLLLWVWAGLARGAPEPAAERHVAANGIGVARPAAGV